MKAWWGVLAVTAAVLAAAQPVRAQDAAAEKTIVANERAVNAAFAKGDIDGFKAHVAASAWMIDPMEGRMSMQELLEAMPEMAKSLKITSWDLTDTKVMWVDANTAVLTYKWVGQGTYQGQPLPSTWASTVWTKRDGTWTAVFHHESAIQPAPAAK